MVATLFVAMPAALGHPSEFVDQQLDGQPACTAEELPDSELLELRPLRQSFAPSRAGLTSIELCLDVLVAGAFTLNLYEGGTADQPGTQVSSQNVVVGGGGSRWEHFELDVSADPTLDYVIELEPGSLAVVRWRHDDGDRYPRGESSPAELGEDVDFGFRTYTEHPADLQGGDLAAPELICPGLEVSGLLAGRVTNVSEAAVGAFSVDYHLSSDETWDPAVDPLVASVPFETGLAPGQTADVEPAAATIPAAVEPGPAHILQVVDATDEVVEHNDEGTAEDNNVATTPTTIVGCGSPEFTDVRLDVDPETIATGFRQVEAADLPLGQLANGLPTTFKEAQDNLEASPYGFSPVGFSPVGFSPVGFSPVGFSPVGFSPYGFSPVGFSPVGFSPVGFSPVGFSNLADVLDDVPAELLDTLLVVNVPIVAPGWEDRLEGLIGDRPIQDVTLGEALALLPDLTLQDVDTRAVINASWLAFALADGTLDDLPVPDEFADWCDFLAATQDYTCGTTGFDPAAQSLLAAEALGVNTRALPIGDLALDEVVTNDQWLVTAVPLAGAPSNLPGSERAHVELTRFGTLPADVALVEEQTVVDCRAFDCRRPLGDAGTSGAFLPGTTVADLLDVLSPDGLAAGTLTDLALLITDFGSLDLGDMFWPLVDPVTVDPGCPVMTYHVTAANVGDPAVHPRVTATLAQGFGYVPGSATLSVDGQPATAPANPQIEVAEDGTRTLTVSTDATVESTLDLTFQACANLYTGHFEAGSATVEGVSSDGPFSFTSDGSAPDMVTVVEQGEEGGPTDTPDTAQEIGPNAVVAFNLQSADDADHFQIPVAEDPESLTIVRVFPPPGVDVDAWAHGPAVSPVGFSPVGFSPVGFSPVGFSPVGFSPYGFSPVGFSPYGFSPVGFSDDGASNPDTLNDVPTHLAPSDTTGLRAVSANRGNLVETLVLRNHDGDEGDFTIGVSGYNGLDAAGPVILTVQQVSPTPNPKLEVCTPAPWDLNEQAGSDPVVTWDEPGTLFVTNRQVVTSAFGQAAADDGIRALDELAALDDVRGVVLEVDHDADVRAAYTDWQNNWCSPAAANVAASLVRNEILELRAEHPSIDTIVLAGGDEILPDFRLLDTSLLANEAEYTDSLLNAYGQNNPVVAAYAAGLFPSADPYGTDHPAVYGQGFAYTPSAGVSRLVEHPDTWVVQKDQYLAADGLLDPEAGFVSAYQGQVDGATAAADALEGQGVPTTRLTDEGGSWTADDFRAGAFAGNPDAGGWYAHTNNWALLSSAGSDNGDATDLVTTSEASSIPFGGLVFSNGCHFGTQVPDLLHPGSPTASEQQRLADWDQAITQRAGIAVANSGFGIFDTEIVGYGEQFQTLFVEELQDAPNASLALARAKAKYFASLSVYDPYHYKTMQQLQMYGLGILKMFDSSGGPGDGDTPADADSIPLTVGEFPVADTGEPRLQAVETDNGTYYDLVDNGIASDDTPLPLTDSTPLAVNGYPIVPKVTVDVTLPDGKAAVGAWIDDITSVEVDGVDPAISRAAVSRADREVEDQVRDAIFPTSPATAVDVNGTSFVTFVMGAFRSDPPVNGETHGTFRLDTRVDADLLLRDADIDGPAPFIREVTTARSEGSDLIAIDVLADETFGENIRAAALGLDDNGTWTYRELSLGANRHWTTAMPLSPGATELVELLVQVRNDHRIAYWRNKGEAPLLDLDDVAGDVELQLFGEQASNGVFLGDVTAQIVGTPGVVYTAKDGDHLLGDGLASDATFLITGDGAHEVEVVGSDGARVQKAVIIDGSVPTVRIDSPADGAELTAGAEEFLDFTVMDTGTGATCDAAVNGEATANGAALPTDTIGDYTIVVACTDAVGHAATATATYTVVSRYETSDSFDSPIMPKPRLNRVESSATVPVRFKVFDPETGELISDVGIIADRFWQPIDCRSKEVIGDAFMTAGGDPEFSNGFHFNLDAPAEAGCYELVVLLDDGTPISAYFQVG